MKKPVVELSECILCGVCEAVCPAVFKLNEVGYIEVTEHSSYPVDEIDEAIKNCPTNCITWEED
ncbi:ferredoxin [Thermodesulfobacteriota bacterium]